MDQAKEMAKIAFEALEDKKGEDVCAIDISAVSVLADYFVIATGNSERQVGTLSDDIGDKLAEADVMLKNIEGKQTSGWILMDYGDVIINIMTSEMREHYNIERVWGDCNLIHYEEGTQK